MEKGGIGVKGDRRGGWHGGQKTEGLLRKKVRGGGRMILLSLVR